MEKLIKKFSNDCEKSLIIEWVDPRRGGPYHHLPESKLYTFDQFKKEILKEFSTFTEIGITNKYNDPKRAPRITYICEK
jgi:hypothetical protein